MNCYKALKEGETNEFLRIVQRLSSAFFKDKKCGFDSGRCKHIESLYV